MPIRDTKRITETIRSFEGGVDSGLAPLLIQRNQVAWAINCTQRGGFIGNRPGFVKRTLDTSNLTTATDFTEGYFQGAGSYTTDEGNVMLTLSVSGRLWSVDISKNYEVSEIVLYDGGVQAALPWTAPNIGANVDITLNSTTEIAGLIGTVFAIDFASYELVSISGNVATFENVNDPPGTVNQAGVYVLLNYAIIPLRDRNSATGRHAWFCQAENYLVVQDGESAPILWDGTSARRAGALEVPVGGPMAYGRGRLWVANGSLFYGGDLVYSDPLLGRGSVIKFTENTFLAEGGAFAVPGGPITGLTFAANLDTALGDGDLLVFTADQVSAFQAPIDRTTWSSLEYPIQRFALLDAGGLNHESISRVNGDVFYRSDYGFSSLIYARRDFGMWGNSPISREVARAIKYDSKRLLYAASAVTFDNRYLATVNPQWNPDRGVWHGGLVAMNFDLVSRMTTKTMPVWEGVWTGLQFLQLVKVRVKGVDRCFAFALEDGNLTLWEISKGDRFDFDGEDDARIPMVIETGSFTGGDPDAIKRLLTADMWFTNVAGEVDITAKYRSERSDKWNPWATQSFCVQYRSCADATPPDCQEVKVFREAGQSRVGLPQPPNLNDPIQGGVKREAYEFQLRLEITGHCELRRLRCSMHSLDEASYGDLTNAGCSSDAAEDCQTGCKENEFCDPDDFEHRI